MSELKNSRKFHITYARSSVILALLVIFNFLLLLWHSPSNSDVGRLRGWEKSMYLLQNSLAFSIVAIALGLAGIFLAMRLRGTIRGAIQRHWFGIYGTASEFVYAYSLAAVLGGLLNLATKTRM